MNTAETDYMIVKDFCEKHALDVIDTFVIVKRVVAQAYGKD